ncbi:MAG: FeoB-associated Cys-rich membrane protein [Synergistaceae bacterium]|nr:FeoB-associated Cys-rich membrane protein [Synergistaceae bacterium]
MRPWDILLAAAILAALVWAVRALASGKGRGCMGGCAHCPRRAEGRCVWRSGTDGRD